MTNFQKIYLKIINQQFCTKYNQYSYLSEQLKNLYPVQHWFYDSNRIINQTIKAVELTPVPDQVLMEIYKNLNKLSKNIVCISYQKLIGIIQNSYYSLSQIFTKCLKKYSKDKSGKLYILKSTIDTNLSNYQENQTFKKILKITDDENRSLEFLSGLINEKFKNKDLKGLTLIKREIDIDEYKDCLIFIQESNESFKDTLQHQFTHFIQRVCQFDKDLPKIYTNKIDKKNHIKIYQILNFVCNNFKNKESLDQKKWDLYQFIIFKLQQTQQHQTIKSLIKFFIRRYQKSNEKFQINHKFYSINQIQNFQNKNTIKEIRRSWIQDLLSDINSYKVFNNSILERYFENKEESRQIIFILFSILYLVVKTCYQQYKIDELIFKEFQIFKFRDF